jgi:hypothetical protein
MSGSAPPSITKISTASTLVSYVHIPEKGHSSASEPIDRRQRTALHCKRRYTIGSTNFEATTVISFEPEKLRASSLFLRGLDLAR